MEQQVKTKKRVADHGEVFTSKWKTNAMISLVKRVFGKDHACYGE